MSGNYDAFLAALRKKESQGNYIEFSELEYAGAHQVGKSGLAKAYIGSVMVFLFSLIVLLAGATYAEESYTKTAEMMCGDTMIKVTTECYDDAIPHYPLCSKQYFEFTDKGTGKVITEAATGKLMDDVNAKGTKTGQFLDTLAKRLQCVKGASGSYLIVGYHNGGNCEECEWQEILDLTGKRLVSNRAKTKKSLRQFNETWERLRIERAQAGGRVPNDQFIRVPLQRKEK